MSKLCVAPHIKHAHPDSRYMCIAVGLLSAVYYNGNTNLLLQLTNSQLKPEAKLGNMHACMTGAYIHVCTHA